jgi:hypothetical protein
MGADLATFDYSQAMQLAQAIKSSPMLPAAYRGKPDSIIVCAMMGAELGWGLATAMRFIQVIEGKPTVSPEGQLALVRRAGHSVSGHSDATGATVEATRSDTGDTMTVVFTMDDARRAGLTGKDVWKKYPEAMLWARAVSMVCRRLFSDVLLGAAYTAEEIGGDSDALNVDGDVTISGDLIDRRTPGMALFDRMKAASEAGRLDERGRARLRSTVDKTQGRELTQPSFDRDPEWLEATSGLLDLILGVVEVATVADTDPTPATGVEVPTVNELGWGSDAERAEFHAETDRLVFGLSDADNATLTDLVGPMLAGAAWDAPMSKALASDVREIVESFGGAE